LSEVAEDQSRGCVEVRSSEATSWDLGREERRRRISTTGTMKARVFPEPVAASTATSLCDSRCGMAAACTGVHRWKPPRSRASTTSGDSAGDSSENLRSVNAPFRAAAAAAADVDAAMEALCLGFGPSWGVSDWFALLAQNERVTSGLTTIRILASKA